MLWVELFGWCSVCFAGAFADLLGETSLFEVQEPEFSRPEPEAGP